MVNKNLKNNSLLKYFKSKSSEHTIISNNLFGFYFSELVDH